LCLKSLGFKCVIKPEIDIPKTYSLIKPVIIDTIAMLTLETLACTVNSVRNKLSVSFIFNTKTLGIGTIPKSVKNEIINIPKEHSIAIISKSRIFFLVVVFLLIITSFNC
jgi:hypothetical protein